MLSRVTSIGEDLRRRIYSFTMAITFNVELRAVSFQEVRNSASP